ncbi:MAG: cupin domain-containing protein [Gemmatimonadota bacterium]|nr:cupin domain-containing protein [Gemmatimonadota bacterium]
MNRNADYWISELNLKAHPEGGHYREIYRSCETVQARDLPDRFNGPRAFSTAIYYLLEGNDYSALHRIRSDEIWHFYAGSSITIHTIDQSGVYERALLGNNPDNGESLTAVINAGCWYGATLNEPGSYSLMGGTVAPGFEFEDFELANRADLIRSFPRHLSVIQRLTR